MSYIGRQNLGGAYRQLDDISSGFDGSDTTHTMQVNSQNVTVGDVNQIILSLGGVIQKPGTDFTVSGSVLTFTTAPAANTSFFAILLGSDNGGTVTPTDESVTTSKLANTISGINNTGGDFTLDVSGDIILDAGGSDLTFSHDGATIGRFTDSSNDFQIKSLVSDKDIVFKGNDGGSEVTAWTMDMSAGGHLLPGNASTGIYLGVNSATAANLLDDFEEGTWTPTIGNNAGNETMTLNSTYSGTNKAYYTKVGQMVHIHGYIVVSGNGTHANSSTYLGGLPFAVKSGDSPYSSLDVGYQSALNVTAGYNMGGYARVNNSNIALWLSDTAAGGSVMLRDEISDDGEFIFSCTYSTN